MNHTLVTMPILLLHSIMGVPSIPDKFCLYAQVFTQWQMENDNNKVNTTLPTVKPMYCTAQSIQVYLALK